MGFSFLSALGLALVHVFAARLRFIDAMPRSRYLSLAGGVSVAYVFVHLLPELSEHQHLFTDQMLSFLRHHVYVMALLGLSLFYGLERLAKRRVAPDEPGIFWLHIISFVLYNTLVGYLLSQAESSSFTEAVPFFIAMALHFIVNDYGLRQHYRHLYDLHGRWLLTLAVMLGWLIGVLSPVSDLVLAAAFAFLSGGVILNVLKEELPEDRESRFGSFALGAAVYTALLLSL